MPTWFEGERAIRCSIDDTAPGFLGFFYRKVGASTIGKAFLAAHASYLET